jgi:hypothetical protein
MAYVRDTVASGQEYGRLLVKPKGKPVPCQVQ